MNEEVIALIAGRRLDDISNNGIRVIAEKLGIPDSKTDTIPNLQVAIKTIMGEYSFGQPA